MPAGEREGDGSITPALIEGMNGRRQRIDVKFESARKVLGRMMLFAAQQSSPYITRISWITVLLLTSTHLAS